jgi:hypothetical protein
MSRILTQIELLMLLGRWMNFLLKLLSRIIARSQRTGYIIACNLLLYKILQVEW